MKIYTLPPAFSNSLQLLQESLLTPEEPGSWIAGYLTTPSVSGKTLRGLGEGSGELRIERGSTSDGSAELSWVDVHDENPLTAVDRDECWQLQLLSTIMEQRKSSEVATAVPTDTLPITSENAKQRLTDLTKAGYSFFPYGEETSANYYDELVSDLSDEEQDELVYKPSSISNKIGTQFPVKMFNEKNSMTTQSVTPHTVELNHSGQQYIFKYGLTTDGCVPWIENAPMLVWGNVKEIKEIERKWNEYLVHVGQSKTNSMDL